MGLSWVTGGILGESEFGSNSRVAGHDFWGDQSPWTRMVDWAEQRLENMAWDW